MNSNSIGFIGGGRITRIFLQGFYNKNALPESIGENEPEIKSILHNKLLKLFEKIKP